MTEQEFLDHIRPQLEAEGITCRFEENMWVYCEPGIEESRCSGFFDSDAKVLAVAMGKPNWFGILVHEYCHFEQWRDRPEWWATLYVEDGKETLDVLMEVFYEGRELDEDTIYKYAMTSADVELDCEKRVLAKIAELDLPLDPAEYARAANSYVTFYHVMPKLRGWCGKVSPYMVPEIVAEMPDHMSDVDYAKLAEDNLDLYRQTIS